MKHILFLTFALHKYTAKKLDGAIAAARKLGWSIRCEEFGGSEWNLGGIIRTVKPNGVIFEGGRLQERIDLRPFAGLPVVFLDTDFPATSGNLSVRSDAAMIADLAANELLRSSPKAALAFSLNPKKVWSINRTKHFQERMKAAKIPFKYTNNTDDLLSIPRPFAVFAINDHAASIFLEDSRTAGLTSPNDFTLVSVDNDITFCENSIPKVSSIEQDFHRSGYCAVEALDTLFTHGLQHESTVMIPPRQLVRRASSIPTCNDSTIARHAADYIESHAIEGLTVSQLVTAIGCSRRTLETRYRAAYGHSVGEAILAKRFAEVERLLSDPSQQIEPIANLCGWASSTHLKRLFRSRYGITMSSFRNSRKQT